MDRPSGVACSTTPKMIASTMKISVDHVMSLPVNGTALIPRSV
jgi:hypothetical protein